MRTPQAPKARSVLAFAVLSGALVSAGGVSAASAVHARTTAPAAGRASVPIAAPVLSARRAGKKITVHWRVGNAGNPIVLLITSHSSSLGVPPFSVQVRTNPHRRHGVTSLPVPYGPGPYTVKGSSFSKVRRSVVTTWPVQ